MSYKPPRFAGTNPSSKSISDFTKCGLETKAALQRIEQKPATHGHHRILAWKSLPADLIQKSFKICALTTKTDGSEDNEIYGVKHLGIENELREHRQRTIFPNIEDDVESSDESVALGEDTLSESISSSDSE